MSAGEGGADWREAMQPRVAGDRWTETLGIELLGVSAERVVERADGR